MAGSLEGLVAVVTGASSGIGRATALRLSASGATTVLVARRHDRLAELNDEIGVRGGRCTVLPADVTDGTQAVRVVEDTVAVHGRLDILVNNAGVMLLGPVADAPVEEWDRMIDLNVRALLRLTHAALPHLVLAARTAPRGVADVVNVSSIAGRAVRSGNAVYGLTKFGVGAFSESLRQELAGRYVRVSVIEPGATETELSSHVRPEIMAERRKALGDVVRLAADDVADAIDYVVTRSREVALNEVVIRPTTQVY
ncbi:SDR family NAD(P)-dependent oxidoreductase [Microbispora sp. CA-102843]|uniref:SDR family NAD(P)-dependent oxidoreductase n=1 Tax=Microbispora sp. CA-102843 TaxID=3239952 RepID=UPI003D8B6EF7